ncbi:ATP-binding protein [Quisquiliibacterium transsilvanicum]|uniref:histidine kinase n=1 Tax=Quisquiliibacterium transsilvanicum TaxID=1549638 RepID=A0A7W8HJP4_9BURK|nr:ATP-binding protein [Quisquiliibacterium transsilvanicum]MBB5272706.1 signal transduction histidine kinase [Quisquiliibacterium transsilvanicum]
MRFATRSLRWRLLGATLLTVTAAMLVAGWSLAGLFREYAETQFEAQLRLQLDQLTAAFEPGPEQRPQLQAPLSDPRWSRPYSGLYWQIERLDPATGRAAEAQEPARSRSLWDVRLELPAAAAAGADTVHRQLAGPDGQSLRALERRVRIAPPDATDARQAPAAAPSAPARQARDTPATPASEWRLVVAADDAALQSAVARFTGLLALFLAILGVALLAAALAQVHLGLKPLRNLQSAIADLRSGRAQHLAGSFPAEVEPLADDLNRVLDENRRVVERARQLAGNLAHAIKTPLAVLAGLSEDQRIDRATLSRQLAEQVTSIRGQVDWQLKRARQSSAGLPGQRTEVAPIVEGLVRVMRKVHAHRENRPELEIALTPVAPGLRFAGESQDLHEMVGNLLDNACKWAHRQVRVGAAAVDGSLLVTIDDDGPGLTEAERDEVFRRGVRADERTPGTGLGLAIARETAELYGGRIALGESPLGGLRAELELRLSGDAI